MEVHNALGNGFQEVIYQRALAIEFSLQGLFFVREMEMELSYKGEDIGTQGRFFCGGQGDGGNKSHRKTGGCS